MRKILIVDDNENNRMLIRALLEDYSEENDFPLRISEANNGLEASVMAESEHFHLIFMDIMMPEMDGIEATRRIRGTDSKVMLVAVSAVDDGERQRQILRNGAEDYIAKPINADIFTARLGNYFSLIAAREVPRHQFLSAHNLYANTIYSRQINFFINSEDELAEFWEYYLLDSDSGCEELSDSIRTVYAIAAVGIRLGANMQITVEESDEHMFITLLGIEPIEEKILKLVLVKNPATTDYKIENGRFSLRLSRPKKEAAVPVMTKNDTSGMMQEAPEISMAATAKPYIATEETIEVFDYMDDEDLEDLKGHIASIDTLFLMVGKDIERSEVEEIILYLEKISKIMTIYTQSYNIGHALANLASDIRSHIELFIQKSHDLAPMCAAFSRDLSSWLRLIFIEGASSVHYMDDTIIANTQTISSILRMDDAGSEGTADLDDIFDF